MTNVHHVINLAYTRYLDGRKASVDRGFSIPLDTLLLGADTAICPLPDERAVLGLVAKGCVTAIIWRWLEYGNGA